MSNAIEQAYELGWRRSAEWSKRDDLLLDIGSPTYERYRGEDLAHLYAQAQVRMTDAKEAFFREYPGAYEEFDLPGIQALWRCWQSSWNAARLSQGAQGAQGEASKPHSYRWRRHGRDEWHWAEWIPISDDEVSEMRNRGWDVEVLYTYPAERAAVPDGLVEAVRDFLPLACAGDCCEAEEYHAFDAARERVERALTAFPQPPEGARVTDEDAQSSIDAWNTTEPSVLLRKHFETDIRAMRVALEDFAARPSQGAQGEAVGFVSALGLGALRRGKECRAYPRDPEDGRDYVAIHTHPAERAAVPDGWSASSALVRVNPAQMVRIAQTFAAADQDHSYTKVENFMPHDWVVAAMCAAYDAGRQNVIDGTHTEGFTQAALDRLAVAALEVYDATRWDRGMPANGLAKMRAAIAAVFRVDELEATLTAAPQPPKGARVVDVARSARKIRGSIIRRLEDFHESFPAHWCGYLDDALGAAEVIADELDKLAAPTLAGKENT